MATPIDQAAIVRDLDTFACKAGNIAALGVVVAELMDSQRGKDPTTVRCAYAISDLAKSLVADLNATSDSLSGCS